MLSATTHFSRVSAMKEELRKEVLEAEKSSH
jgi:hypothetical protein